MKMLFKNILALLIGVSSINCFGQSSFNELYEAMVNEAQQKNYEKAVAYGEQAEALAEKALGKNSIKLGSFYYNLGNFALAASQTGKAEEAYKKCLSIRKITLGEQHPDYIKTIDKLAVLYNAIGKESEAKKLLAQLNTSNDSLSTSQLTLQYAKILANQAVAQIIQREYQEAQKNFLQSQRVYQKLNQTQEVDYATVLNGLGFIQAHEANFTQAESLFLEALNIRKQKLGQDHALTLETHTNLAVLYEDFEAFQKAIPHYQTLVEYYEQKATQPDLLSTIRFSTGLAKAYLRARQLTSAEASIEKTLKLIKENSWYEEPAYAEVLQQKSHLQFSRQQYKEAKQTLENALKAQEKRPPNPISQANLWYNYASIELTLKNTGKAEIALEKAKKILEQSKNQTNTTYFMVLSDLADVYNLQNRYQAALLLYEQALLFQKEALGNKHPKYLYTLSRIADTYILLSKYIQAQPLLEELLVSSTQVPALSKIRAEAMLTLAGLYYEIGDLKRSEGLFAKYLEIYKPTFSTKDISYLEALRNLANLYKNQNRYEEAEKLYKEALEITKETLGEKHKEYAGVLGDLATLHRSTGRFNQAEEEYRKALSVLIDEAIKQDPAYASALSNLATLYKIMGKLAEAEPLFKEALSVFESVVGQNSVYYAESLQGLASLYTQMGRFNEAITQYQKVLNIRKEILGRSHPEYATTINALASLYRKAGQLQKAEPLYLEALEIRKTFLGEKSTDYAISLNDIANFYQDIGQLNKAEPLYKQSLEIRKNLLGALHPAYAAGLNNLAILYEKTRKFSEAETNYLQALDIFKKTLGEDHANYLVALNNLALFYDQQNKFLQASQYYQQAVRTTLQQITTNFPSLSENEKRQFFLVNKPYLENFIVFASNAYYKKQPGAEKLLAEAFNLQMATKGMVLNSTERVRKKIIESNNEILKQKYYQWQALRELIAKSFNLGNWEFQQKRFAIDSLVLKANELEKEISRQSGEFEEAFNINIYQWQQVQSQLKANEALIEIVRLQPKRDTVLYAAFVIKPDSKSPQVVLMRDGNLMEEDLYYQKNTVKYRKEDKISYDRFWAPLAPSLEGVNKVYFSPDGLYTQMNLATLWNPKTQQYLIDEVDIIWITNSKDLAKPAIKENQVNKQAIILGNPTYLIDKKISQNTTVIDLNNQTSFWLANPQFAELPGTQTEVQNINKSLNQAGWDTQVLLQENATEQQIKKIKNIRLLHLATHGFFIPSIEREDFGRIISVRTLEQKQEDPLLRSGLVLAGVSDYFYKNALTQGQTSQPNIQEDGILTAYEVMNLSLEHTELVVLSACETGLGKVQAGEGVYGLQRAFKVAGAKSLLMSLWQVDDEATQLLMTYFYEDLIQQPDNKRNAFLNAQKKLRIRYKEPYYWGAFIMVGD